MIARRPPCYQRVVAKVIGLTGGIASGKSTVAAMLRARGAAVVDADQLAREVVAPGQPAFAELVARFGLGIVAPDGSLDRKALGAKVFGDADARRDLNAITHPRIAAASQAAIARHAAGGAPVVFYEAALLIENQVHRGLDGVIVVAAPREIQAQRLAARDALAVEQVEGRLAAQLPLEAKLAAATWVIDNRGDLATLAEEVDRLWHSLEAQLGPLVAPAPEPDAPPEEILVTGVPAATAVRLLDHVLAQDPRARIHLVVPAAFAADTAALLEARAAADRARVHVLTGDVAAMDLGLATAEYRALAAAVTTIHHLAALFPLGVEAKARRRHRVAGTRSVVDLAADAPRLRRLVHWSSVRVSGDREGVVREDELDLGQRFDTPDDEALFEAERAAEAAKRRLPVTVLRLGHVVDERAALHGHGDSATAVLAYVATNPWPVQLPLPGGGSAPFHLVPIDYVVAAGYRLALDERAAGKTCHLVDPSPMPVRRVLEHVAELAGLPAPKGTIPSSLARFLLRAPGLTRVARVPAAMLALVTTSVVYASDETAALLDGTGITCPPFEDYAADVVATLKSAASARRKQRRAAGGGGGIDDETIDPLV